MEFFFRKDIATCSESEIEPILVEEQLVNKMTAKSQRNAKPKENTKTIQDRDNGADRYRSPQESRTAREQ
jgi:hypothetical protein